MKFDLKLSQFKARMLSEMDANVTPFDVAVSLKILNEFK